MPSSIKKDLYLGKSMHDLNKLAGDIPKVTSARVFATSAEKVYRTAEEAFKLGDEERSYVLYMKYFNLVSAIKKSADYKKQSKFVEDLIGKKNCMNAIERAEELSTSLKTRYEEAEAIEVSKKLDKLGSKDSSDEPEKQEDLTKEVSKPEENGDILKEAGDSKPKIGANGGIDVQAVYRLMKDPGISLILMDVRSAEDFELSHIESDNSVSIPESAVLPGCTVSQIEKKLPSASVKVWKTRGQVDYVVLFNWRCSSSSVKAPSALTYLKDALFKWDQGTILRAEPLIMEGGYEEWLMCYPSLTTGPSAKCPLPPINGATPELPSLDSIDYDVALEFLQPPKPPPPASPPEESKPMVSPLPPPALPSATPSVVSSAMPSIDRSTKPKAGGQQNEATRFASSRDLGASRINNKIDTPSKNTEIPVHKKTSGDKNVNVINSRGPINTVTAPPPPVVSAPSIDRSKKPLSNHFSSSSDEDDGSGSPSKTGRLQGDVRGSGKSSAVERLEEAEMKKVLELRKVKEAEARSLAELMRKKKRMEDELRKNEQEVERKKTERSDSFEQRTSRNISADSDSISSVESETYPASKDMVRDEPSSTDRGLPEGRSSESDEMILKTTAKDEKSDEQRKNEDQEQAKDIAKKQEEMRNKELEAERQKEAERQRQLEKEAERKQQLEKEAERQRQLEKEAERQRQLEKEAEKKRQLEKEAEKQRQLEKEAERQRQEDAERRQKAKREEEEALRLKQEQAEREIKEKERLEAEAKQKAKQASGQSGSETVLPSGWEKRFDEITKRYYYIDHRTKQTQWDPPGAPVKQQGDNRTTVYKERLKDEDGGARGSSGGEGGGLKRSHSSPNIAKMIQDEEDANRRFLPSQPQIDRSVKPKANPSFLTVKTEVSEAKVRNLQPTWGSMGAGLTGLRNLGNTCYMNSTLQCLSNAAPLTVYFLTDSYLGDVRDSSRRYRGEVASEYAVLIKAIWRGQYKALSPRDFKGIVCKMEPMFASTQHQDSHELLEILMNGLNEDLNKVRIKPHLPEQNNDNIEDSIAAEQVWKQSRMVEDSIIVDLFRGQYKSTVMCIRCNKKSVMFESFMCLNLPIPSPTRCSLSDCLLHFSKEEKMVGDSQWHCPRCKSKQDAIKRIVIWRLPPILIVHLERFYYQGIWRDKITANVDFPVEDLDMNRYNSGPTKRSPYNLFAVSNHFGTLDGGHYTAYCKSPVVGKWYKFDDQDVSEMSKSDIKSSAAYLLFYSSMKMDQLKL